MPAIDLSQSIVIARLRGLLLSMPVAIAPGPTTSVLLFVEEAAAADEELSITLTQARYRLN